MENRAVVSNEMTPPKSERVVAADWLGAVQDFMSSCASDAAWRDVSSLRAHQDSHRFANTKSLGSLCARARLKPPRAQHEICQSFRMSRSRM